MDELLATRIPRTLPIANVLDNAHPCSYLPNRMANLPLILPGRKVTAEEFDHLLMHGLRRSGYFTYFTACEGCSACEPTRVDVRQFRWSDSWRRILNRGDRLLQVEIASPSVDDEKLRLFNEHRIARGLGYSDDGQGDDGYSESDYEGFLVHSCCESTLELRFLFEGQLVAVSITDCGSNALSAVYTYFDIHHDKWSLGTYSILKQIEYAEQTGRQYVYLGLFVAANRHLNYKSRFLPQQRLIDGQWLTFTENGF